MCVYGNSDNKTCFARIEKLIDMYEPVAVVREIEPSSQSILSLAGNPCRQTLTLYKQVDLLFKFYKVIPNTAVIMLSNIIGKAVLVSTEKHNFIISQPNN